MIKHMRSTSAASFVRVRKLMTAPAVPSKGSGVPTLMTLEQDATTGFLAWSPPV
jgi:hypothetical protein